MHSIKLAIFTMIMLGYYMFLPLLTQLPTAQSYYGKRYWLDDRTRLRFGKGHLDTYDRNNDGQIALQEYDGPAYRFAKMDKNGNGLITKQELNRYAENPRVKYHATGRLL